MITVHYTADNTLPKLAIEFHDLASALEWAKQKGTTVTANHHDGRMIYLSPYGAREVRPDKHGRHIPVTE